MVEVQTTDMVEVKSGPALVDCGATGQFMDHAYVERNRLAIQKLHPAITMFNVDGSPNEAGSITEIVNAVLCYNGHTEQTSFAVTSLEKQDIILGFTWPQENNPEINWQAHKVLMSHCPDKCHICRLEVQAEQKEQQKVECHICACCSGPHSLLAEEESELEYELHSDTNSASSVVWLSLEDTLEEGDPLLYMNLLLEVEHIQETCTTSQCLAEASQKHAKVELEIPEYLQELEDVFAKESFDALPVWKVWDQP
jgi:Retroviral aspartyl protease